MNDLENNELHDDYLSKLYQQSRVEEPPMALDSNILTQARKAVAKPEKKRVWNRIGWLMPLATVAVAMLTVSLIIQTKQEHPEVMAPVLMHDVSPMQGQGITEQKDEEAAPVQQAVEKKAISEPVISKAAVTHQPDEYPAPAKASKPVKAKRLLELESVSGQRSRSASTLVPAEEMVSSDDIADAEGIAAALSRSAAKGELSADAWLKQIRAFMKAGKTDEAIKSLDAFRKAYPDHQLPEDIKSFSQQMIGK